jgi:hypothetical protein
MREKLQNDYNGQFARDLISHPLEGSFSVEVIDNYKWQPDDYSNMGTRGGCDVNKNVLKR